MRILKQSTPPTGVSRLLFRLPIWLYRLRLGWLLGGRFLYLVHVGRTSGKRRETVVEIAGIDTGYLVCAGFGPKTAWYRNVAHSPRVWVQVGRRRTRAVAEFLSADEGAEVMAAYGARHPRMATYALRTLMNLEVDGSVQDFREAGRTLPFVRFVPIEEV